MTETCPDVPILFFRGIAQQHSSMAASGISTGAHFQNCQKHERTSGAKSLNLMRPETKKQ